MKCVIPNCQNEANRYTGYLFKANGKQEFSGSERAQFKWGWCDKHIDDATYTEYANPIFENQEALELFKKVHPQLWSRQVHKKPLFLQMKKEPNKK